MLRTRTGFVLDHPEAGPLLDELGLSPGALSPFVDMLEPGQRGTPRPVGEILREPREDYEESAVRDAVDAVARPDRFVESRIALFGTLPEPARFHSSRAVGEEFTALRPGEENDVEFVFPFTSAEIQQWAFLQMQFSAGVKLVLPEPCTLDLSELTALLGLADAWKVRHASSIASREPQPPDVLELSAADIVDAIEQGRDGDDGRFAINVLETTLRLLVRPGGRSSTGLPRLGEADVQRALTPWIEAGEIMPSEAEGPTTYEIQPTLGQLGSSLYTWISTLSFHDVQVVEGGRGDARSQEELLLYFCTPVTIWALASEGLTQWDGDDPAAVRFEIRSCSGPEAIEILDAFLQPIDDVTLRPDLYSPEPTAWREPAPAAAPTPAPAPAAASGFCTKCGHSLTGGTSFCTGCGSPKGVPAAVPAPPAPVAQPPNDCRSCGAPRLPGKDFCTGCGGRFT